MSTTREHPWSFIAFPRDKHRNRNQERLAKKQCCHIYKHNSNISLLFDFYITEDLFDKILFCQVLQKLIAIMFIEHNIKFT